MQKCGLTPVVYFYVIPLPLFVPVGVRGYPEIIPVISFHIWNWKPVLPYEPEMGSLNEPKGSVNLLRLRLQKRRRRKAPIRL
jgi:hypothetical protein